MMLNKKLIRHGLYSLYKCLYHWEALAAGAGKYEYFRTTPLHWNEPRHGCYCCEHTITLAEIAHNKLSPEERLAYRYGHFRDIGYEQDDDGALLRCYKCPLTGFAWDKKDDAFCQDRNSDYGMFQASGKRGDYEAARFYAGELVKCIQKAILAGIIKNLKYT